MLKTFVLCLAVLLAACGAKPAPKPFPAPAPTASSFKAWNTFLCQEK